MDTGFGYKQRKTYHDITGRYLFFSDDKKLIEIAVNEMENHGFHHAKVNETLFILCLFRYYQIPVPSVR